MGVIGLKRLKRDSFSESRYWLANGNAYHAFGGT